MDESVKKLLEELNSPRSEDNELGREEYDLFQNGELFKNLKKKGMNTTPKEIIQGQLYNDFNVPKEIKSASDVSKVRDVTMKAGKKYLNSLPLPDVNMTPSAEVYPNLSPDDPNYKTIQYLKSKYNYNKPISDLTDFSNLGQYNPAKDQIMLRNPDPYVLLHELQHREDYKNPWGAMLRNGNEAVNVHNEKLYPFFNNALQKNDLQQLQNKVADEHFINKGDQGIAALNAELDNQVSPKFGLIQQLLKNKNKNLSN